MKKIIFSAVVLASVYVTAQNTGIGTTTPQAKLDIVGSGNSALTKALRVTNSDGYESISVLDNGRIGIRADNPIAALDVQNRIRIDSDYGISIREFDTPWSRGLTYSNADGSVNYGGFQAYGSGTNGVQFYSIVKYLDSNTPKYVATFNPNTLLSVFYGNVDIVGRIYSETLKGVGDRMVVADANGVLKTGSQTVAQATSKWTNDPSNQVVKLTNLSDSVTARTDAQNIFIKDKGDDGVGGNSPFGFRLDVNGIAAAQSHFSYGNIGTLAKHPHFKNLVSGPTGGFVTQGTVLGSFGSHDLVSVLDALANNTDQGGSSIISFATQDFTATNKGSDMRFYTTNNNTALSTEKMRLDQNGNVAIGGDTSLGYKLDVKGPIGAPTLISYNQVNGQLGNHSQFLNLTAADTANNYVSNGAVLGGFGNYDSKSFFSVLSGSSEGQGGASIRSFATENYSSTNKGSKMEISTTPNGAAQQVVRMTINHNGNIGVGTVTPTAKLQVAAGDVYIDQISRGVIMKSPDGTCYRYTPANGGALTGTAIPCP